MKSENSIRKLEKVLVVSRTKALEIGRLLTKNEFKLVEYNPDFVVCYGGDGTVLFAERKFPEIPKLIVKKSLVCRKCDFTLDTVEEVLDRIKGQRFAIRKEMKLRITYKKWKLIALNEVQVHTKLPVYAIRFSVVADDVSIDGLIGDGVVVATPFGSTGYYKSIGGKQFAKGIGVSFNNLHNKQMNGFVIPEDSSVRVRVERGPAWILADNNLNFVELKDYDVVEVRRAENTARFITIPQKTNMTSE